VNYIGTAISAPYAPANFAASPVLPASLPIQAGDLIGIQTTSGNGLDSVGAATPVVGARAIAWALPALSSTAPDPADPLVDDLEMAVRATIRFCAVPDLKGKKLTKAIAALAAADCKLGAVKQPKGKRKRKKAKFVVRQSSPAGTSISDTAPIELKMGKKPKKKKK
jgi:hypothetical protein